MTTTCASCASVVVAGNFCEVCGARLESAADGGIAARAAAGPPSPPGGLIRPPVETPLPPAPPPDPATAEAMAPPPDDVTALDPNAAKATLVVVFEPVENFRARNDEVGIALAQVRGGTGVVPVSTRSDDGEQRSFAVGVRLATAGPDGVSSALDGPGVVTFSRRRAFGVVIAGKAKGGEFPLRLDDRGRGVVGLFSIDRAMLDKLSVVRSRRGTVKDVFVGGPIGGLGLYPIGTMASDRSFEKHRGDELPAAVRALLGLREEAPELHPRQSNKRAWALAAAIAIVLATAGALYALVGEGGGGGEKSSESDAADMSTPDTLTPGTAAPHDPDPPIDDPVLPPDEATAPNDGSFVEGDYVQLGLFRSQTGAEKEAARLEDAGLEVEILPSDDAAELIPGFQTIVSGPLGEGERKEAVDRAKDAGVPDAFARDLSPDTTSADPTLLGDWSYEAVLDERGEDVERSYSTLIEFATGGQSASISYPELDCGGELKLTGRAAPVLEYEEQITYGNCVDLGTWHVRPTAERLGVHWEKAGHPAFVSGWLDRLRPQGE